jgi:hypothetical protein
MDPAESLDNALKWWERVAFKRGFLVGFLTALLIVWMKRLF